MCYQYSHWCNNSNNLNNNSNHYYYHHHHNNNDNNDYDNHYYYHHNYHSELSMGRVDRLGVVFSDMWRWNTNINEGDPSRSSKWWSRVCWRLHPESAMQYQWLPSGLPVGTVEQMGSMLCNLWWGNSNIYKANPTRSRKWWKKLCG